MTIVTVQGSSYQNFILEILRSSTFLKILEEIEYNTIHDTQGISAIPSKLVECEEWKGVL